jgi:hypothetical protein
MLQNLLQRRLRMEMLEDKRPLAANLLVEVVDGDLVITGDAGDNRIEIQSAFPDGEQYELVNLGSELDDTINGMPFDMDHYFSGVTGNVIINLGDGDDWVVIEGTNGVDILEMPGDLRIDMGAGDDLLALGLSNGALDGGTTGFEARPLSVAGDLVIEGGAGADKTWISSTLVGDDFRYTDTQGNASLRFLHTSVDPSSSFASEIGDDFSVTTGGGNDIIDVQEMTVGGDLMMSAAGGDDTVGLNLVEVGGSALVSLGGGHNEGQFQDSNLGSSFTALGSGSNAIFIAAVTTSNSVMVVTSNGNDLILLGGVQTGTALVTTGSGADELSVIECVFDNLLVTLGGGSDLLTIGGTTVNGLALLLGGGGADTYLDAGGNDILLELDLGFESLVS